MCDFISNITLNILEKIGVFEWIKKIIFERGIKIKTAKGVGTFILGSNSFFGCQNILVSNNKPLIQIDYKKGRLFLTATILDKDNIIVARIFRNKIIENKDKIFSIERHKNKIILTKKDGEYIEFIVHDDGKLEMNGTFYCDGNKFEATSQGFKIN